MNKITKENINLLKSKYVAVTTTEDTILGGLLSNVSKKSRKDLLKKCDAVDSKLLSRPSILQMIMFNGLVMSLILKDKASHMDKDISNILYYISNTYNEKTWYVSMNDYVIPYLISNNIIKG